MWCPALELAVRWVELGLSIEMEISERALADWYYMGPWGLWWSSVLNLALPPQRHRPDTQPEHQDPMPHGSSQKVSNGCNCRRGINRTGLQIPDINFSSGFIDMTSSCASVGGSPAEAGGGCGSPQGQGHWQQKFSEVLLGVSPPRVCHISPTKEPGMLQCWIASG